LLHPNGLEREEIDGLWAHMDLDKNGVLDFKEFMVLLYFVILFSQHNSA
jgi:Ca2+-binding EF-hand superfamily protein